MKRETFQQLAALFASALELPPGRRTTVVEQARALDPELGERLQAMLRAHESEDSPLDRSPVLVGGDAPPEPAAGERLGPFRVLRRLGAGGMATVLLVEVREPGEGLEVATRVALKLVRAELAATRSGRDRLLAEAELGRRVVHDNLVRVHAVGEVIWQGAQRPYVALEPLIGQNLRELLRELGRVPEALALRIADRVLDALEALHRAGVVHRDVKPENVLLTAEHEVKLMDLGIAQAVDVPVAGFAGTLAYAAPEQLAGAQLAGAQLAGQALAGESLDGRADLFSLGVVVWELLTGAHPLPDRSGALPDAPPALSPALDRWLRRLLADRPDARPADVAAARALRRRLLATDPVTPASLRAWDRVEGHALRGRERELTELSADWRRVEQGVSHVSVVVGPPGSGRTRLLRAAVEHITRSNPRVAVWTLDQVEAPEARTAVAALVRDGPAILLADDVERVPESLPRLTALASAATEAPLWLLASSSRDDLPPGANVVELDDLAEDALAAIVRDRLGGTSDTRLVERIAIAAAGRPGFAVGIVDELRRGGRLRRGTDGGWIVATRDTELVLPESAHELWVGRVAALGEDDREVLRWAALLPEPVPVPSLVVVADRPEVSVLRSLGRMERLHGLVRLEGERLRFAAPEVRPALLPDAGSRDRRVLHATAAERLRNVDPLLACEQLVAAGRAEAAVRLATSIDWDREPRHALRVRVLGALDGTGPDARLALAHSLAALHRPEEAIGAFQRLIDGDDARVAVSALLGLARLHDDRGDSHAAARAVALAAERHARDRPPGVANALTEALVAPLLRELRHEEALAALCAARDAARDAGESAETARLAVAVARVLLALHRTADACAELEAALPELEASDDVEAVARALLVRARVSGHDRELDDQESDLERVVELAATLGDESLAVEAQLERVHLLQRRGRWDDARRVAAWTQDVALARGLLRVADEALVLAGISLCHSGRLEAGIEHLDRYLARPAEATGGARVAYVARVHRQIALARLGRIVEAREQAREVLELARASRHPSRIVVAELRLLVLDGQCGRADEALERARAVVHGSQAASPRDVVISRSYLTGIALAGGAHELAEASAREVLGVLADRADAKEEAEASVRLASTLVETAPDEAVELLDDALPVLRELGRDEARAVAAVLRARLPGGEGALASARALLLADSPSFPPYERTRQLVQVARLAPDDRELAAERDRAVAAFLDRNPPEYRDALVRGLES